MSQNIVWEDIEIPGELDIVIEKAVEDGFQKLQRNRRRKWRNAVLSFAGVAALLLFVGAGFVNPMIARAYCRVPFVGNIFSYLYHVEGERHIPYSQVLEDAELVQDLVEKPSSGLEVRMQEAYCDGYSLYLSMQLVSDTPFYEVSDAQSAQENMEGFVQMFCGESILAEDGEQIEIGNGSLNLQGVFPDAYTFVGVARSGKTLESYKLPEESVYTVKAGHIKGHSEAGDFDVTGEWEYQGALKCSQKELETVQISAPITGDTVFRAVRMQPYEIQVIIEEPVDNSLASQELCVEAFDENGNRLKAAANESCRIIVNKNSQTEIWAFGRPEDAEKITVFVLDEIKWLDEWKGHLYSEDPWSGEQMVGYLGEHCVTREEVELK